MILQLRRFITLTLIGACTLLGACDRESATYGGKASADSVPRIEGKLHLTGSTVTAPLMLEIAKRFHELHPNVNINIEMGSSERGLSDLIAGKSDIGMVARVITDKEQGLKGFPIARDGVGLIVHKNNPVTTLTVAQTADIFSGRIKNWSKVGGANAPILVINREEGRGLAKLFTSYFKLNYSEIQAETVFIGDFVSDAVVAKPNGISYISIVVAEKKIKEGAPVKLVALDGIAATRKNVMTGDYRLARPLTLVTRGLPTGLVKSFIEYSLSQQVVDIVEKMGYIPYQE